MDAGGQPSGAAQRRRQRRLRSWWRHEQQSIALGHVSGPLCPTGTKAGQDQEGGGERNARRHTGTADTDTTSGDAVSLSPGRKGATAACGAPQGTLLSWVCHRWPISSGEAIHGLTSGSSWTRIRSCRRRRRRRGSGSSRRKSTSGACWYQQAGPRRLAADSSRARGLEGVGLPHSKG